MCWHRNGEEFLSAHIDGSYIVWSVADSSTPKEPALTPYGKHIYLLYIKYKITAILKVETDMIARISASLACFYQ